MIPTLTLDLTSAFATFGRAAAGFVIAALGVILVAVPQPREAEPRFVRESSGGGSAPRAISARRRVGWIATLRPNRRAARAGYARRRPRATNLGAVS